MFSLDVDSSAIVSEIIYITSNLGSVLFTTAKILIVYKLSTKPHFKCSDLSFKKAEITRILYKPGIRLLKATVLWPIKSRPIGSWSQTRKRTSASSAMWSVKDSDSSHTGLKPGLKKRSMINIFIIFQMYLLYFRDRWSNPVILLSTQGWKENFVLPCWLTLICSDMLRVTPANHYVLLPLTS